LKKKNIYLDIDGVLLTTKNTTLAQHSIEFIDFILDNYNCYWLTTHCQGDSNQAIKYLTPYFDRTTLNKLELVKPTIWKTLKTEAIEFASDFFWIEDYPFTSEKNILIAHNCLHKLITVNLNRCSELKRIIDVLK